VHQAANRFTAAVLLPWEDFQEQVYLTGFDIPILAEHYSICCSQILLPMTEVIPGRLFFSGAFFAAEPLNPDRWVVQYAAFSRYLFSYLRSSVIYLLVRYSECYFFVTPWIYPVFNRIVNRQY
jgi:hypothetical protein